MHTLRTRFGRDIIAEFLPPKRQLKNPKTIILLGGMPTVPAKKPLIEFLSSKNFWVFFPRYRGSWESGGKFLEYSPETDVLEIIKQLPKGFTDLWNSQRHQLISSQTILLGSSFGGPASILASTHPQIDKVCAISPVIDWTKPGKEEPIDQLKKFTAQAFGQGYRPVKNAFEKLASGKFYNPINSIEQINGKKLLLIHAKDDQICPYQTTKKFAQATQSKLITLNQGGHLSSSTIMLPKYYKLFKNFINAK